MIQQATGVKVLSLHYDISTETGEELVLCTRADVAEYLIRVFHHVGFFACQRETGATTEEERMDKTKSTMAQQIAQAAIAFEQRRTGSHVPKSVTVVLSEGTLVITLHDALSPAEKELAKTPAGAAQMQDFHRQLFASSSDSLRQEINRITGMKVREATAEVEPASGAVVQAFTTGAVVQVFLLAGNAPTETWSGNQSAGTKSPEPTSAEVR